MKRHQKHTLWLQRKFLNSNSFEQAQALHEIEDYDKAKEHYEKAAELHQLSETWSYLASNFFAWAKMDEAESLSRNEKTELSQQMFQKALEQFKGARDSINKKIKEISSDEEKELVFKLLKSTDVRISFCEARILIEASKALNKRGKHLQSSKIFAEAGEKVEEILEKDETKIERKELELIAVLCRAWEKMALAEGKKSANIFLEAAELFDNVGNLCSYEKTSLWALGNSSFCRGLAAGINYQKRLDLSEHVKAKRLMNTAATNYRQAGFSNASEQVKATQRLFDAYVYINQAEGEPDPGKSMKYYSMAEKVLQLSKDSFMKAKESEKIVLVQRILESVREEKVLAISLNEVMQAPIVASTTSSFPVITPTSEVSVGLESFEHANVQANIISHVKEVKVGESFCLSVEFVNAGREPALLLRVDNFIPSGFVVVKKPEIYRLEKTTLNMKGKQLGPLKLVEVKLTLQPSKKGQYNLNPLVHYLYCWVVFLKSMLLC
ncbi:MAG: tetratricopeptide repeat protein [Candidatus Bathyarchaeota archaeon]